MAGAREILALFSRTVAKRTRRGLYAGKNVLSGNNISDDGGNKLGIAFEEYNTSHVLIDLNVS